MLADLCTDGIELNVDHGAIVSNVVFQYNLPYTIFILRRNEIGVPIRIDSEGEGGFLGKVVGAKYCQC